MDINASSRFRRAYAYSKHSTKTYNDGKGDDITLELLTDEHDHNDPLTILINEEERLLRRKQYPSFKALSHDLNKALNSKE